MSYSPGPPENEPAAKMLQPLARLAERFKAFYRARPVAAWLRMWMFAALVVCLMAFTDGLATMRGPGDWLWVLFAATGWIIPLVIFIRQRETGNDN